jgi:endonuclease YncB( thermonuclease family)
MNDLLNTAHPRVYPGSKLLAVEDGDTQRYALNLGFTISYEIKARLAHVNCPELSTVAGKKARAYVVDWLNGATELSVTTYETSVAHKPILDKYGRVLAVVVRAGDGIDLGSALLREGLAVPFEG